MLVMAWQSQQHNGTQLVEGQRVCFRGLHWLVLSLATPIEEVFTRVQQRTRTQAQARTRTQQVRTQQLTETEQGAVVVHEGQWCVGGWEEEEEVVVGGWVCGGGEGGWGVQCTQSNGPWER